MRIMIASVAPWASSGYGTQAAQLSRSLRKDGHTVAFFATHGLAGGVIEWEGMEVFPSGAGDTHGNSVILGHVDAWKPDVVISLLDVWPMTMYGGRNFRWIPWVPIDHDPPPPAVLDVLKQAWRVVSMSQHGKRQLIAAGVPSTLIPLGIPAAFYPDRAAGLAWRKDHDIPADAFVYGCVGMNVYWPPRKGFDRLLEAFASIAAAHDDAYLYLHCTPQGMVTAEFDLWKIIDLFKIPRDRVRFSDPYPYFMGYTVDGMRAMYNSFNVLVLPTQGEGFGVPVVEAQACGTPVIASNCTSMPELVHEDMSILVDVEPYLTLGYAYQYNVKVPDLIAAMEQGYERLHRRCECSDPTCDGYPWRRIVRYKGEQYMWNNIYAECWRPFLAEIAAEIGVAESGPQAWFEGTNIVLGERITAGATSAAVYRGTFRGRPAIIKLDMGAYSGDMAQESNILRHPMLDGADGFPNLYTSGVLPNGRHFLVMSDNGPMLSGLLPQMDAQQRLAVYQHVEFLVHRLHSAGLVHRDVKLENIAYDPDKDVATLCDFGWAMQHSVPYDDRGIAAGGVPVICCDIDGRGLDELPAVTRGLVSTGLPTLLAEIMAGLPEGEIAMSHATAPSVTKQYQSMEGVALPHERDCLVRWQMMTPEVQPDVLGRRVLDLGCNLGWFSQRAKEAGALDVLGVDVDPTIIKHAQRLAPNVAFMQADLDTLPFEEWSEVDYRVRGLEGPPVYDVVFAFSVIMHLKRPARFWGLLDHVKASVLYFEPPAQGEYGCDWDWSAWEREAFRHGWKTSAHLGYTDRNRPLLRFSR